MSESYHAPPLPSAFIWRRAHSLTGLGLVLFLIEHLLTNSQAALFIGDDGSGFVSGVNFLKGLPYLPFIEIFLLGVPFAIHGWWGVKYLMTSKSNSFQTDGSSPALPQYARNRAYTWQRITSWLLLFGILAHVIHMRVIQYPSSAQLDANHFYVTPVHLDNGLYTLSKRLGFDLYTPEQVTQLQETLKNQIIISENQSIEETPEGLIEAQKNRELEAWIAVLKKYHLKSGEALTVSKSFGIAELLMVRDTFKSPVMIFLYTGLVLAACFHAFNGLWTAMISWGLTLTENSQRWMRKLATLLMVVVAFLGLAAIWVTYWVNLMN